MDKEELTALIKDLMVSKLAHLEAIDGIEQQIIVAQGQLALRNHDEEQSKD